MKLEVLTIENFRGVRGTYEFGPNGENAIIVGPNGSGKSSILEAIDFLLTDDITHLSGEGMGVVNKKEVIPNVGAEGDCVVWGTFRSEDGESEETLVRDADSGDLEPSEDELSDLLRETIDTARQGQHILTRSDLLDLVLAQPQTRREVLTELLNLPDIDERRLVLKRTRQRLQERREEAKASRETVADRLREITDSVAESHLELERAASEEINALREWFDAEPVEKIGVDVRGDVESPAATISTEALQRELPQQELEAFSEWLEQAQEDVAELVESLESNLAAFRRQETGTIDAKHLELLELGEDVVSPDADECPLCRQKWTRETPLLKDIRERRRQLAELRELRQEIDRDRKELRETLNTGLDSLKYLEKELDQGVYPEAQSLVSFRQRLEDSLDILSGDLLDVDDFTVGRLPFVEGGDTALTIDFSDSLHTTRELESKAADADDLSRAEDKYERIRTIADQWVEYQKLDEEVAQLQDLKVDADEAESAFVDARKEVIGDIYDQIASRVEQYYSEIHPDESGTNTSLEVTETGAELHKEFYDAGEYAPQAVHSEGHLDTLGLCLHLALTDYLQQDNKSLLLLDDVVMSVDQDHRLEVARLIADEFAEEYQVIITTHDELWAEQLRSQGALQGGERVWLREWSLDGGVTESQRYIDVTEQWETAEKAMEAEEMQRAAHELRYATEKMLQQTCIALGAKVEYDPRQRYTLSDFKDAVCRRLNTLTGRAKDNLHRHNEDEEQMWEKADELDSRYGQLLNEVGQRLDRVNRQVHWTPGKWLTLGPEEFEEVFEAHKAAYELLYCDECGSSIRYESFDDDYHELRCNCRGHYDITWN
jgi:DNA repair exonuclease SbcCD ATPase subunit